jgi:hypothetical protein
MTALAAVWMDMVVKQEPGTYEGTASRLHKGLGHVSRVAPPDRATRVAIVTG